MDSSTSHSKARLPKLACALLAVALLAWGAAAYYSTRISPDVTLWCAGEKIKNAWDEKMMRKYGYTIVVVGDSSCAFAIDGELVERKFNLPMVNYGLNAGIGSIMLTEATLPHLRRGDTLIVTYELPTLAMPLENTSMALQFCEEMGHPEWALNPVLGFGRVSQFDLAAALRPGGRQVFTMIGKVLDRRPMYRYRLSDYRPSGWIQTGVRLPRTIPGIPGPVSADNLAFLRRLADWCEIHGVRVAYSSPWTYAPSAQAPEIQEANARILLQIARIMPVLSEPSLGVDTNATDFADANTHLTASAAEARSEELGRAIVRWDIWKSDELLARSIAGPQRIAVSARDHLALEHKGDE